MDVVAEKKIRLSDGIRNRIKTQATRVGESVRAHALHTFFVAGDRHPEIPPDRAGYGSTI
ncbi:MAG: hypothetical protein STSR0009_10780 [Methanoregula sp.]